jgi:alkaline phosphatase D
MIKYVVVLLVFMLSSSNYAQQDDKPYVILVSLDGFRWDYNKFFETPNLDTMAKSGVNAKSMKPSYPTKTFPIIIVW